MRFQEDFLYYIWQYRLLKPGSLYCETGERVEIISPGLLNKHSGPDFQQARLRIDQRIWSGNVEIHLKSSDWKVHGHQRDGAYDSVILHVVYEHDHTMYRRDGTQLPVLSLKGLFDETLFNRYLYMLESTGYFACSSQIRSVPEIIISGCLSRTLIERLENKSAEMLDRLRILHGDWEACTYYFLAKNFGFKVNSTGFELLAASLPYPIIAKHRDQAVQIDALVFGQAGFLRGSFSEPYPSSLKDEYQFLSKKYGLHEIDVSVWKFLRMRPQNFPTLRLAQFAALLVKSMHLFSTLINVSNMPELCRFFSDLPVHSYWHRHYHFGKLTMEVNKMGSGSVHNLLINTVAVLLFAYGRYTGDEKYMERAIDLLEQLPAERNALIQPYVRSGLKVRTAYGTQALLQLNKCYCSQKKCLNCGIGNYILKK